MQTPTPPRWADQLLEWFCVPHLLEEVQGDLHERFKKNLRVFGPEIAQWEYIKGVLGFIRPFALKRKTRLSPASNIQIMISNYFKIAWRNLIKGKSFSFINITGLAIGMAGTLLIILWLQNELSFDKFHINKDRLHEVYFVTGGVGAEKAAMPYVSQPLGPALKQNYPEVEDFSRVTSLNSFLLTANEKNLTGIEGAVVDQAFLKMFSFPFEQGNPDGQLSNVSSIVITDKLAKKLFGDSNAINKTIKINNANNFVVTGVLKDLPSNTRFSFEYLLPWDYFKKLGQGYINESWLSNNTPTYVLLKPNVSAEALSLKIKNITQEQTGRKDVWTHFLYPLEKWHLYAEFKDGVPVGGRIETVRVFSMIAIFILLIACINFMNLNTARSEKRAKEIGVRKVAGAGKGLLIGQFIMEALMIAFFAGVLALLIVQIALPSFNTLINTQLTIPYGSTYYWVYALAFILFTGLLAGFYPAFYLSSFNPIGIFKKQFRKSEAGVSPRKVLVVIQFTFAIVLIICTIVVHNQIQHAENRSMGYSKSNLIHVSFSGDIENNYGLIKQELLNEGVASSVTKTMTTISQSGSRTWGLRWRGEAPKDTNTSISLYSADAGLVQTTGMKLIAGRDIDINQYPTDSFAVLLNETAVKLMGFKNPIGEVLFNRQAKVQWRVVGVVKDYVVQSPYDEVPPVVIQGPAGWFNTIHIKLNAATAENLAKAEQIFRKYNHAYPFDYSFVDQEYAKQFANEQRTKTLSGLFASLAICISCLGLFGLASYVAEQRTKEIGIRKVLGASVASVWGLLSKDFVVLVVISILLASPIAYYFMNEWLQKYTYRTELSWTIFAMAGIGALALTLMTISYQVIKAALLNPVKTLKSE